MNEQTHTITVGRAELLIRIYSQRNLLIRRRLGRGWDGMEGGKVEDDGSPGIYLLKDNKFKRRNYRRSGESFGHCSVHVESAALLVGAAGCP